MDVEWLSTAEVARRLGVTPATVHRMINRGELVGYKLGRVVRIRESDLADFIERARTVPGTLGAHP